MFFEGCVVGFGYLVGDFFEVLDWCLLNEVLGCFEIVVDLFDVLCNLCGNFFGGFLLIYVDFVVLFMVCVGIDWFKVGWMMMVSMNVEYLVLVIGLCFCIESEVVYCGCCMFFIDICFFGV